ncbi:LysR family transcriptional regulator [Kluyvera chengduensis]|uniref:LysR family transcriptional regulator n=1 Tax=Kluyvera sp. 142359 TaxID=3375726 RepID=UPI003772026E
MLNQFELIKIFCAAAESRSFREAAALLGKSPQSITRAIKELEALRGEILFYRSTRSIRITREGEALAQEAGMLMKNIERLVIRHDESDDTLPSGHVNLTMPASFGRRFVVPALNAFRQRYPDISVTCILTDTHSDVVDEKIDIGLRTGFLRDNRYVARKIRDVRFYILGTPELIRRVGKPSEMEHLNQMPVVALLDHCTGRFWPWTFDNEKSFTPDTPRFVTDDLDAYCDVVAHGAGFGQLADYLAHPLIEKGLVLPVMQEKMPSTWGLYIYRPQIGPVPARIRLLFDYLVEKLQK